LFDSVLDGVSVDRTFLVCETLGRSTILGVCIFLCVAGSVCVLDFFVVYPVCCVGLMVGAFCRRSLFLVMAYSVWRGH
jgi:hypothetical protein